MGDSLDPSLQSRAVYSVGGPLKLHLGLPRGSRRAFGFSDLSHKPPPPCPNDSTPPPQSWKLPRDADQRISKVYSLLNTRAKLPMMWQPPLRMTTCCRVLRSGLHRLSDPSRRRAGSFARCVPSTGGPLDSSVLRSSLRNDCPLERVMLWLAVGARGDRYLTAHINRG